MFNKGQRFSTAFQGSVLILTLDTFGKTVTSVMISYSDYNEKSSNMILDVNTKFAIVWKIGILYACVDLVTLFDLLN